MNELELIVTTLGNLSFVVEHRHFEPFLDIFVVDHPIPDFSDHEDKLRWIAPGNAYAAQWNA